MDSPLCIKIIAHLKTITRYFDCYVHRYTVVTSFELYDYVQHKDNFQPENILETYHIDIVLLVKTSC